MKSIRIDSLAVFVIFFGLALVEAFKEANWMQAGLFAALGILSVWADFKKK